MPITIEILSQRERDIESRLDQLRADYNAYFGALQEVKSWTALLRSEDVPVATVRLEDLTAALSQNPAVLNLDALSSPETPPTPVENLPD